MSEQKKYDKCVHTEHCCMAHGCKYGDPKCPVSLGYKKQSFDCEYCMDKFEHMSHIIEPSKKAIDFALDKCTPNEGMIFLDLWRNGEWTEIKLRFKDFVLPNSN